MISQNLRTLVPLDWSFGRSLILSCLLLHWVSIAVCGLSLVAARRSYSLAVECGLLVVVASLVVAFGLQSEGSVVVASGLVALRNMESSRTRDQARVPCVGRWLLNHWTARDVQVAGF